MLFRSKPFQILVSIFLYSSSVRAQLSLRSPKPRITTRFNCLHVSAPRGFRTSTGRNPLKTARLMLKRVMME
jgi:hypothetical protein